MKDVCKQLQIDTKIYKERALLSAISSAKDEMVSPDEFELKLYDIVVYKKFKKVSNLK